MLKQESNKPLGTIISRESKWYALYTLPRHEKKVSEIFSGKDIESLLPFHRILKQWSDRKKWVEEPIFKSYIFVNIGIEQYIETINTEGILGFVRFSGRPEPIPQEQIDGIIKIMNADQDFEVNSEHYELGEKVKVKRGALSGLIGYLVEHQGKHKVLLHVEVLNQNLVVNVPISYLEKFF